MLKNIKDTDKLVIGGVEILRGERKRVQLVSAALYDYTQLTIPVEVIRGVEKGPVLFISAAVHGDEVNGTEIIRKLLKKSFLKKIKELSFLFLSLMFLVLTISRDIFQTDEI